jgi:hypothetical protein
MAEEPLPNPFAELPAGEVEQELLEELNPWDAMERHLRQEHEVQARIAVALERIAAALEQQR